jgi:cyclomaltodextrinase
MKFIFVLLGFSLALTSCNNEKYFTDEEIFGLASPVNLSSDTTFIVLNDYFMDVKVIRKITVDPSLNYALSADKKVFKIWATSDAVPVLSEMLIETGKGTYSILVKKNLNEMVPFSYPDSSGKISRVSIRGEMNNWNNAKDSFIKVGAVWKLSKMIEPGIYEYLLNINGKDQMDQTNSEYTSDGSGGHNSVLRVGMSNALKPQLSTSSNHDNKILINAIKADKIIGYWQNQSISILKNMIVIPKSAGTIKRSYIRVYAYNKEGSSNDLLIPLENGKVITDSKKITREDKEGNIYYFLMVDRFMDGNKSNTQKVKEDSLADRVNYLGGDIAGITQKIKEGYFSSLGINTLWVSPLNQNPEGAYRENIAPHRKYSGYQGYWVVSTSNVDHRFGTEEELKTMVAEAHKNNINVILNLISNKVHIENPIYHQHKSEWFKSLYSPDGTKNIRSSEDYDFNTRFDEFLAAIDYTQDAPLQLFTDSAVGWIKRFDLDGFRHNAVKDVPQIFWRTLTYKLKNEIEIPQKKHLIQIGETFGSRSEMNSYTGSGQLDAQFDFNVYFDARSAFIDDNVSFTRAKNAVNTSLTYFGHHHLMGNITGSNDINRFMAYAGKGMSLNDKDAETGWKGEVKVADTLAYKKLQMMMAFITTIPGTPVIYYGDEVGMTGVNDPNNRRPMLFDNMNRFQVQTRAVASKLCELRRREMSLMYGTYEDLDCNEKVYSYIRRYFNEATLVIFNKFNYPQIVTYTMNAVNANTNFGSTLYFNHNKMTIAIAPHSFEIVTMK